MGPADFAISGSTRFHDEVAAVDAAAQHLRVAFPAGYREFIGHFGEGTLGRYVRVYPPHQLLTGDNSVVEWRKRIDEYWFWDQPESAIDKQRALECVIVADTVDGDEIAFHPSNPDELFVLPRYEETIYVVGSELWPSIEWLLSSCVLTEPIEDRTFEPFDGLADRSA